MASLPQTSQSRVPEVVSSTSSKDFEFQAVTLRKRTVAAFLANARTWTDPHVGAEERARARAQIAADLPALRAQGLFEVMEVRDQRLMALVHQRTR